MPIVKLKDKTQHFQFDEAIKMLRTNVEFAGENVQAVCITSCLPNEGKSSIVARLAESMAQAGKKVVLIDADLRKSVLLGRYIVEGAELKGLSHFLTGQGTISECLCQTDYPTLQMIFSPLPDRLSDTSDDFLRSGCSQPGRASGRQALFGASGSFEKEL